MASAVEPERFDLLLQFHSAVQGKTMADVDHIVLGAVNNEHDRAYAMDLIDRRERIATPRSFRFRKCHTHARGQRAVQHTRHATLTVPRG